MFYDDISNGLFVLHFMLMSNRHAVWLHTLKNNYNYTAYRFQCNQCRRNHTNASRVARMPVDRYAAEYNMRHNKRGMAIIFNHEHFEIMSLKSRTGTNVDCENLRHTLEHLQFDVVVHKDLRYGDIQQKIEERKHLIFNFEWMNEWCLLVFNGRGCVYPKFVRADGW